jgi:hypothetical protein
VSFQEKSAIAMTGPLALVDGAYFAIVGRWLTVTRPTRSSTSRS